MAHKNDSWGIEVGSYAIKGIHLVRQGSEVSLARYAVLPFKKVLTTPNLDVEQEIHEHLQKFFSTYDVRRSTVTVSVPGSAAFAKFAKLPPVDPKKISDIVKFEAVQQIPFPIEDVEWDYQIFSQPDSPDVEVGIFAITKDRVAQYLANYQRVDQPIDGLTLSALAVYNAMAYDLKIGPETSGMIFMDIGTLNTDVIIVESGNLWLRTLPIGGNNFTEALVRAFKLSFAKAEKLKQEANTSKYTRQIFQAMRPVFTDLIQELQRTLGFYQSINHGGHLTRLIGLGSTFRLPGMQKFLKQQLQMDLMRLDEFQRIHIEGKKAADFAEHALNLATAYGLALQGLGLEKVRANVLPKSITKQRVWRAKQPWFAVAAALMMSVSIASWVKLQIDQTIFKASMVESQPRIDQTISQANEYVQQWRQIEGGADPRMRIENLRRILDYRDLWPKLMYDLTLATSALRAQPQLIQADYEAIKKIPRNQRRRIYIESVTAEYQFTPNPLQSGGAGQPSNATVDDIWKTADLDQAGEMSSGLAEESVSSLQVGAVPGSGFKPPAFVVTVKGTTPYRDGPRLISQHLIKWLQENSRRGNRPYRILVTKRSLQRIEKMRVAPRDRGGAVLPRAGRGNQPALSRRAVTKDRMGRLRTRTGIHLGRMDDPEAVGGGRLDIASLLPQRPLDEESRVNDWSFEIQWTVVLVRPEDARLAEENRSAAGGAVIDGGAVNGPVSSRGLGRWWGGSSLDATEDPS